MTDFGGDHGARDLVWEVLLNDEWVATIVFLRSKEMFWDSYAITAKKFVGPFRRWLEQSGANFGDLVFVGQSEGIRGEVVSRCLEFWDPEDSSSPDEEVVSIRSLVPNRDRKPRWFENVLRALFGV